jgi:hypothetical protein
VGPRLRASEGGVTSLGLEKALRKQGKQAEAQGDILAASRDRSRRMLAALTPKQRDFVLDPSPHVAGLCPRRAGKSYAGATAALALGEAQPGSISLIISLNKTQLRRLYWSGGPSGLFTLDRKYGCGIKFNNTFLSWEHQNGSIGYLLGCEDEEQLEVIRGLEADLYLIDECKSFAPGKLTKLIDDIIDPQRSSRMGRVMMIGTPGFIMSGPFYEATCPDARSAPTEDAPQGKPLSVAAGEKDPYGRTPSEDLLWSRHHWTLQDNTAKKHQWTEALKKKRQKQWADDDPTWLREYLGMWTYSADGLVYRYAEARRDGRANWVPDRTPKNISGLPQEGAPWRFVAGLDIGFEEPTAITVAAYSQRLRQFRHVWDESHPHLLPDDIEDMIRRLQERFGPFEKIFADGGNNGKMVVKHLIGKGGFPLELVNKREKPDFIDLLNSALVRGEVQIVAADVAYAQGWSSDLEHQLLTVAWDLGDGTKESLAKLGKLVEDPSVPNDTADSFLYCYRGSLHHFGGKQEAPPPNSDEAFRLWQTSELKKYRARLRANSERRMGTNHAAVAPPFVREALRLGSDKWTSTSSRYKN